MPAYRLASHLACAPDLRSVAALHRELDISLEAAARRFIELHDEPLAVVMTKDQVVRYSERNSPFPQIKIARGNTIPSATRAHRVIADGKTGVTGVDETYAAAWLHDPDIELFEQTHLMRLSLIHISEPTRPY